MRIRPFLALVLLALPGCTSGPQECGGPKHFDAAVVTVSTADGSVLSSLDVPYPGASSKGGVLTLAVGTATPTPIASSPPATGVSLRRPVRAGTEIALGTVGTTSVVLDFRLGLIGFKPDGAARWRARNRLDLRVTEAVLGGTRVYAVGTTSRGGPAALQAIDARTGALIWKHPLGASYSFRKVTLSGGLLYAAESYDSYGKGARVEALEPVSGTVVWTRDLEHGRVTSMDVSAGSLLISNPDALLGCM